MCFQKVSNTQLVPIFQNNSEREPSYSLLFAFSSEKRKITRKIYKFHFLVSRPENQNSGSNKVLLKIINLCLQKVSNTQLVPIFQNNSEREPISMTIKTKQYKAIYIQRYVIAGRISTKTIRNFSVQLVTVKAPVFYCDDRLIWEKIKIITRNSHQNYIQLGKTTNVNFQKKKTHKKKENYNLQPSQCR